MKTIRLPAIRIMQGTSTIYGFAVDGKLVEQFATVARVRQEGGQIFGYQRVEIGAHIERIRAFLDTEKAMLPNAVVIAFDSRVTFRAKGRDTETVAFGELVIPVDPTLPAEQLPGFIIDGQQRLAAIRASERDSFMILAGGFIADDPAVHAGQFVAVNSAKPLAPSLVFELLPKAELELPHHLTRRRLPADIMIRLNTSPESPLYRLIKTATQPSQFKKKDPYEGLIKDTSFLTAIEDSITDGILHPIRNDAESIYRVISEYWWAVRGVFAGTGWGLPPRVSRLMHGVGVATMGCLMDEIGHVLSRPPRSMAIGDMRREAFSRELSRIAADCRWIEGTWTFPLGEGRAWNAIQNTAQDKVWLTERVLRLYRDRIREALRSND